MIGNSSDFSSILLTVFCFGVIAGLFLAVLTYYLICFIEDFVRKQTQAIEIEREIRPQEEQPVEVEDARITCPVCWERRHPGQEWPFTAWHKWCSEHLCLQSWHPTPVQEGQRAHYALTLPCG